MTSLATDATLTIEGSTSRARDGGGVGATSATAAASSVEQTLLRTLSDLRVRSQVEDCVRAMVSDVEIAADLERRATAQRRQETLTVQLQQHQVALAEQEAVRRQREAENKTIADAMVREMWTLSCQMGSLQETKQQHERLKLQYDEAIARLASAQDEIQALKHSGLVPAVATSTSGNEPVADATDADATMPSAKSSRSAAQSTTKATEDSRTSDDRKQPPSEQASAVSVPASEGGETAAPAATATAASSVVSLVETNADDAPPNLVELDTEVLMHIFGFLDALDILNAAQINVSMYSRVDSLFGLGAGASEGGGSGGGDGGGADNDGNSTIATTETAPSTVPASSTATSRRQPPAVEAQTTTARSNSSKPAPEPARKPAVAAPSSSSPPPVTAASSQDSIGSNAARGLFSLLQPRRNAGGPLSMTGSSLGTAAASPGHRKSSSADGAQPMNAAMANSMAAKLTDAELNAIILMTERLKQKEALADRLVKTNEELEAKLDGTEAVKQFLINKVRDMESTLTKSEDNEIKVAQQIASDQEVIAFLDGRVQGLERESTQLTAKVRAVEKELASVKKQTAKKAGVMGDMLQFERQKLSENEREWKATKKLLVKEVKSCRALILSLQAERDGFKEQNDILRNAVLSTPGNQQYLQQYASAANNTNSNSGAMMPNGHRNAVRAYSNVS